MELQIFRRRLNPRDWERFFQKCIENSIKCLILLAWPIPATVASCLFWYYVLFKRHVHYHEELKDIANASWIPWLAVAYCLLSALVLGKVFDEYKKSAGRSRSTTLSNS